MCWGARDVRVQSVLFEWCGTVAIDDTVQQLSRLLLTFHSWVTTVRHLMLGYVFASLYHLQESFSQFLSNNMIYIFLQKKKSQGSDSGVIVAVSMLLVLVCRVLLSLELLSLVFLLLVLLLLMFLLLLVLLMRVPSFWCW